MSWHILKYYKYPSMHLSNGQHQQHSYPGALRLQNICDFVGPDDGYGEDSAWELWGRPHVCRGSVM